MAITNAAEPPNGGQCPGTDTLRFWVVRLRRR